jgi:hypothetical protein
MGIHYVFRYTGYEISFLKTYLELTDRFCTGCHTNEDVDGNCKRCPVGRLIDESKEYLLEAHESDILKEEAKIIRKIKRELKKLPNTHPHINGTWIFEEKNREDILHNLRRCLQDLEFEKDSRHRMWQLSRETQDTIRAKIEQQLEFEKKLTLEAKDDGTTKE